MRRAAPRSGIALLLALALCACERRTRVVEDAATLHAHPEPPESAARWPSVISREFMEVALPEARNVDDEFPQGEERALVLSLSRDGWVFVKGNSYDLGGPEPHADVLDPLRRFVRDLFAAPEWRHPDGTLRVPVLLSADRDVPWKTVAALAWVLTAEELRFVRWDLHVMRNAVGPGRLRTRITPSEAEGTGTLPIRLERAAARPGGRDPFVRVSLGDASVDVAVLHAVDVPVRLAEANAAWDRVATALRDTPSDAVAWVSAGEDVPFAFVVTTLDLLVGAGIRSVELPEMSLRLTLVTPPSPSERREPWDHGLSPVHAAVVLLGSALLAFVGTLRPLRARRRT